MPSMEMNFSVIAPISVSRTRCATQWRTADAGPTLLWIPVLHSGTEPVLGPRQARTRVRRSAPGTRESFSCPSRSLRERDHAREAREDLVEHHADHADHQNGD